ncbi:MAG: hypothetical protein F6J97_04765 [Leptolyngbya sp. SIO4C1]|nr:hypothetical protein [Leptolyngbya sp. SIO4C1]
MKSFPWISSLLLLLCYVAFGAFLQHRGSAEVVWLLAAAHAVIEAAVLSIAWKPIRNLMLLGFQSDVGYSVMALALASLAVVVVVWIQIFAYFLAMLAAALLLRVDLLTRNLGNLLAFLILALVSLAGLGLSWLPHWLLTESLTA